MSAQTQVRPPDGDWLGSPYLRFERHGRVAWVVIDRPEARNALTIAMYFGLRYAVERVDAAPDLDALVITGTGDVFAPGGDLSHSAQDWWTELDLFRMDAMPFEALRGRGKPVVSAVNGICQGGGLMIALLSDLAVVSDRATFRAPELLRGLADMVFAAVLPAMVGVARARDLLLTGRVLRADEAERWGLVSRVVAHDDLYPATAGAVRELLRAGPDAVVHVRRALHARFGAFDRGTMDRSLSGAESIEGFQAFLQRRPARWVRPDDDVPLPPWGAG